MRNSFNRYKTKDWVRTAMKIGLVLTAPKMWAAVNDQLSDQVGDVREHLRDRFDDVSDAASRTYADARDRVSAAGDALRGKSSWPAPLTGFLFGVGIGAGLGVLLAPAPGYETREALRDRATTMGGKVKSKVMQSATNLRAQMPSTGTEGD